MTKLKKLILFLIKHCILWTYYSRQGTMILLHKSFGPSTIPLMQFSFPPDNTFEQFQTRFWNSHKFVSAILRIVELLLRLIEIIVIILEPASNDNFFALDSFLQNLFWILVTMGTGSLFTRLQLSLQPWLQNRKLLFLKAW